MSNKNKTNTINLLSREGVLIRIVTIVVLNVILFVTVINMDSLSPEVKPFRIYAMLHKDNENILVKNTTEGSSSGSITDDKSQIRSEVESDYIFLKNFENIDFLYAQTELEKAGFIVKLEPNTVTSAENTGLVITQIPNDGKKHKIGSEVTLVYDIPERKK